MGWTPIVCRRWTAPQFETYLNGLKIGGFLRFNPRAVTLHHTWEPTLDEWKGRDWRESLWSLEAFYKAKRNPTWSAGPHLFVDDQHVYGFTPLNKRGIHAASFNGFSWGVEMVGDFGGEPGEGGPIPDVQKSFVADILAMLFMKIDVEPDPKTLLFHRDDPLTGKNCPGRYVNKQEMVDLTRARIDSRRSPVILNDAWHIPSFLAGDETFVEARSFAAAMGLGLSFQVKDVAIVRDGTRFFFMPGTYRSLSGRSYLPLSVLATKLNLSVQRPGDGSIRVKGN